MIQAATSTRFPYLSIHVRLGNQQYPDFEFDIEALVDTGFDGGLTVPQDMIPSRVRPRTQVDCILADGSSFRANAYLGYLSMGTVQPIMTAVLALPHEALLGRAVTNHFRLSFFYGRQVTLEQ